MSCLARVATATSSFHAASSGRDPGAVSKMQSRFIRTLEKSAPMKSPTAAKTLSFLPSGLPLCAAPPSKNSKTLLPFVRDAVIARCFPWLRSGRLRGALFHKARSLRRAQKAFAKHLESTLNIAQHATRASPLRRLCPPSFPSQTPSLFVKRCDHLRRPRCAFSPSDPTLPARKAGRPAPGAQIITIFGDNLPACL
jgi:hypothetical protein